LVNNLLFGTLTKRTGKCVFSTLEVNKS